MTINHEWWLQKSRDRAHQHAYRKALDELRNVDILLGRSRDDAVLVDLGCGPLEFVILASQLYGTVVGIDNDIAALQFADKNLHNSQGQINATDSNIFLLCADARQTPLPNAGADIVTYLFPSYDIHDSEAVRLQNTVMDIVHGTQYRDFMLPNPTPVLPNSYVSAQRELTRMDTNDRNQLQEFLFAAYSRLVFAEVYRILKEGGIFVTVNYGEDIEYIAKMSSMEQIHRWNIWFNLGHPNSILRPYSVLGTYFVPMPDITSDISEIKTLNNGGSINATNKRKSKNKAANNGEGYVLYLVQKK